MSDKQNIECQHSKKIPLWRLFLLSASGGSVDLGYAVEGAYAIPLIQAAGIHLTYATLVITLSPIIGLFFQIFLGSASDQCTCQWGRRRPFIVLFAVMAALGFGLAPYSFYFEELNFSHKQNLVAVGVVACVILLDFSIGALQLPARAYLLDVVPLSQTQTGNFIFTISIGANAALGFTLGAIDWSSAIGEKATISNQAQIVFGIAAALTFISMLLTIFSVKESRTQPNIKSENGIPQDNAMYVSEKDPIIKKTGNTSSKIHQKQQCFDFCSSCRVFRDSVIDVCHFIYFMSYHMWLLWLITLLSFVASFAFIYSFTSFVGTVIYGGDPLAPEDSYSYQQYTKGLRIGSIGLIISTIACSILSIGLDYITRWIRLKTIFLIIIAYFTLCTCLLMYFQEVYQVLILGVAYGPFLGIILTVPYTLIPIYEVYQLMHYTSCTVILSYVGIWDDVS